MRRGVSMLGRDWRWFRRLAGRLVASFGPGPRPTADRVARFLIEDRGFLRARERHDLSAWGIAPDDAPGPAMWPAPGRPSAWSVPEIVTPRGLADRLDIDSDELEWLADRQGRERLRPARDRRRYTYRWVPKRSGPARLVEVPQPRLRLVQRRLLRLILDAIPPHDAAHGFRRGRSVLTYVGPHVGRRVVLKLDLGDFFPTIGAARVLSLFLSAGYPEPVARLLTGLCTNRAPADLWRSPVAPIAGPEAARSRRLYREPHLPQGAPTSPGLANLSAYRLDARLSALAASAGASYTRYADDLAFSGDDDFERSAARFAVHVHAIAIEEGFAVNARKTRLMRRGVRQRVAGAVVNDRPNVPRSEYDALKATLHNCATKGPAGQDRQGRPDFRAHLLGRIAHVGSLNPDRGRRLRATFDRIAW